jgi:HemY protein
VARQRYTALLGAKEGAFLGLRGLIGQALRAGDSEGALRLAARAQELRPNAGWAFETLFALQTRVGRWEAARDTLAAAVRRHLLPQARAEHHRGVILYELSRATEGEGDARRALTLAGSAATLVADVAAPAVRYARLLIADGRQRAARRVVEAAWRTAPHPDLARIWGELGSSQPALGLVGWFERLAACNPASPESALALAEATLAAQLWGETRRHLGQVIEGAPEAATPRVCRLMAQLEDSEHPGQGRGRDWLDRALVAPPDPGYLCARCGAGNAEWRALCVHCQGFDTLAWRMPRTAPAPATPPVLPELNEASALLPMPDGLASAGQSSR